MDDRLNVGIPKPVALLNALMDAGLNHDGGGARWRRYFQPIAPLYHGLPAPLLGIMVLIWQVRDQDLQQSFPLDSRASCIDFISWCIVHGRREYGALRDATLLWEALDQPAVFEGAALSSDDPGHAISWKMLLAARHRSDLGFSPENRSGRARLLLWYISHGRSELGLECEPLTGWQIAYLRKEASIEGLSRLQEHVYSGREDVRNAFPLPLALQSYLDWFHDFLRGETSIADSLLSEFPCRAPSASPVLADAYPPGVNVIGYAYAEIGIGEDARMAVKAMACTSLPVVLVDFPLPSRVPQGDRSMAAYVSNHPSYATNLFCLTALEHGRCFAERGAGLLDGRRNIGYWPWELARWPQEWRHLFALVDEVWLSSEHTYQSALGVSPVPLRLMPMAVDVPAVSACGRAHFGLPEHAYLFLFAFDLNSSAKRKNPQACVQAFLQAFPLTTAVGVERVGLVIKVHPPSTPNPEWEVLKALQVADPRIHLIEQTLGKSELMALYKACDCFVSLHRAEGFGRSIAEAMLLGRLVIATGYSGNLAFNHADNALLVEHTLTALGEDDYPFGNGQYWAEPSVPCAARYMRQALAMQKPTRQLAARGRDTILARLNIRTVGTGYESALTEPPEPLSRPGAAPVRAGPRRFIISDPAATGTAGHYLGYTLCIAAAAGHAGFRVEVLCNAALDCALTGLESDRLHAVYGQPWMGQDAVACPAFGRGHPVFDACSALSEIGAGPDDLHLLPTVAVVELRAWMAALANLPLYVLKGLPALHFLLRYDPLQLEQDRSREWANLRRAFGARSALLAPRVHWHADTELLAARYAAQLGVPVAVAPIPFEQRYLLHALERVVPQPKAPVTVLYLGDARPEKGYTLLPALVAALWYSHVKPGKIRFVLQSNLNVPGGQGGTVDAIRELAQYPATAVELILTTMQPAEYYRRLAECDVVLLPYAAESYGSRSSGICIEALAAGKPIVTSAGSWMAQQAEPDQMALFASEVDLPGALAQLLDDLPAAARAAQVAAARWRIASEPATFLRHLLRQSSDSEQRRNDERPRLLYLMDGDALLDRSGTGAAILARLEQLLSSATAVTGIVWSPRLFQDSPERRYWVNKLDQILGDFSLESLYVLNAGHDIPPALLAQATAFWISDAPCLRVALAGAVPQSPVVCDVRDVASLVEHAPDILPLLQRCSYVSTQDAQDAAWVRRNLPDYPCGIESLRLRPRRADSDILAGYASLAEVVHACGTDEPELQYPPRRHGSALQDQLIAMGGRLDLLYVGSANAANHAGLSWFLDSVYLPLLAPLGVTMIVAGNVKLCRAWTQVPSLAFVGVLDDLARLYAASTLCVLPVVTTSFRCMKTVQALEYGKPVVGTSLAFQGLPVPLQRATIRADDAGDYARAICRLLATPLLRQRVANRVRRASLSLCEPVAARTAAEHKEVAPGLLRAERARRTAWSGALADHGAWDAGQQLANNLICAWLAGGWLHPARALIESANAMESGCLERLLLSHLPRVLESAACSSIPLAVRQSLLAAPVKAIATLLAIAGLTAPELCAAGAAGCAAVVVHGDADNVLALRLRAIGTPIDEPSLMVRAGGALLSPFHIRREEGGSAWVHYQLPVDRSFPYLQRLLIEASPVARGWCIESALLHERLSAEQLCRAQWSGQFMHVLEQDCSGQSFAWTAAPEVRLGWSCWRGVAKELMVEVAALARQVPQDICMHAGGETVALKIGTEGGGAVLAGTLAPRPAWPICSDWILSAPQIGRGSDTDARWLGIALSSMSLVSSVNGLADGKLVQSSR